MRVLVHFAKFNSSEKWICLHRPQKTTKQNDILLLLLLLLFLFSGGFCSVLVGLPFSNYVIFGGCEIVIVSHNLLKNKFQPLDLTVNQSAKAFIKYKTKYDCQWVSKKPLLTLSPSKSRTKILLDD